MSPEGGVCVSKKIICSCVFFLKKIIIKNGIVWCIYLICLSNSDAVSCAYLVVAPQDHHQFRQRYFEFLDYFRIPDGPIFLVIGGEGPCNGITNDYIGVSCNPWSKFLLLIKQLLISRLNTKYCKIISFGTITILCLLLWATVRKRVVIYITNFVFFSLS